MFDKYRPIIEWNNRFSAQSSPPSSSFLILQKTAWNWDYAEDKRGCVDMPRKPRVSFVLWKVANKKFNSLLQGDIFRDDKLNKKTCSVRFVELDAFKLIIAHSCPVQLLFACVDAFSARISRRRNPAASCCHFREASVFFLMSRTSYLACFLRC